MELSFSDVMWYFSSLIMRQYYGLHNEQISMQIHKEMCVYSRKLREGRKEMKSEREGEYRI